MKRAKYLLLGGMLAGMLIGCGQTEQPTVTEDFVEFEQITPMESEPIIIREEQPSVVESIMEEESTTMTEEEEIVPWVDRVAGEQAVAYSIETQIYEDGIVKLTYPQLPEISLSLLSARKCRCKRTHHGLLCNSVLL